MSIDSIDLSVLNYTNPEERQRILDWLLSSCATHGFIKFVGHGIPDEQITELFNWIKHTKRLFSFPDEVKASANRALKGPHRGYAGVGQEQIAAISGYMRDIRDPQTAKDESFDLGPRHDTRYPTSWPIGLDCEQFKNFMQSFFDQCIVVHEQILTLLEEALHLSNRELNSLCNAGNGEVHITLYPSIPLGLLKTGSTYRIAEHTDVGILTLLFQNQIRGLEIESHAHSGTFVPVDSKSPGEMIVNIGDTLQRWTGNMLRSTNLRVLYPKALKDEEVMLPPRYSVGFFGKANPSAAMTPLPQLVGKASTGALEEENRSAQKYYNCMHERTGPTPAVLETRHSPGLAYLPRQTAV